MKNNKENKSFYLKLTSLIKVMKDNRHFLHFLLCPLTIPPFSSQSGLPYANAWALAISLDRLFPCILASCFFFSWFSLFFFFCCVPNLAFHFSSLFGCPYEWALAIPLTDTFFSFWPSVSSFLGFIFLSFFVVSHNHSFQVYQVVPMKGP